MPRGSLMALIQEALWRLIWRIIMKQLLFGFLLVLVAGVAPIHADSAGSISGVASVIDGDTIEIHGKRIRLHGIDAPESAQTCRRENGTIWRCGQQAANELSAFIGRRTVTCTRTDTDRYGRTVAICKTSTDDINEWMVRKGLAVAYRRYSGAYVAAETDAKMNKAGMWGGTFDMPWDWRRGQRSAEVPAGKCAIKGNISRNGKRIYHIPGDRWYDATRINTEAGERWFCSESDARKAGWSRARE